MSSSNNLFDDRRKLCPTFRCLGMENPSDNDYSKLDKKYFETESGGAATFSSSASSDLFISASLPSILSVVGLSGDLAKKKLVKAEVSFGGLTIRRIQKPELLEFIEDLKAKANSATQRKIYDLYTRKRLVCVIADVVIDSMEISIEFDKSLKAGVEAKLDTKLEKVLGDDAKFQFKVTKESEGKYKIKTTRPLIIARYPLNTEKWKL